MCCFRGLFRTSLNSYLKGTLRWDWQLEHSTAFTEA
jgi:hypothetical protein